MQHMLNSLLLEFSHIPLIFGGIFESMMIFPNFPFGGRCEFPAKYLTLLEEPHVSFTSPSRGRGLKQLMVSDGIWWFRFASNGILFNHESPRRGGTFVTKKVWHEENLKAIHGSYIPENSHIPGTNGWLIVGIRSGFLLRTRSNCLGLDALAVSFRKCIIFSEQIRFGHLIFDSPDMESTLILLTYRRFLAGTPWPCSPKWLDLAWVMCFTRRQF